jgi:hypothetical protein
MCVITITNDVTVEKAFFPEAYERGHIARDERGDDCEVSLTVGDIQPIKISRALLGIRVGGYMKKRVDIILNNVELVQKQKLAPKGPFYLGKSRGGVLLSFDKIKVLPPKR